MMKLLNNLKRMWFDIFGFFSILILLYLLPSSWISPDQISPKIALLSTLVMKFLYVSAGFMHAHITRKIAFTYIDFKSEKDWSNNVLIIAIYVMFILGWTRGG